VKISGIYTGLFLFLLFSLSFGEEQLVIGGMEGFNPRQNENRYEISLALSGGGARGFAAIGILKAFEENNIDVTAIAGTSMGGIIGGLYASGYTPKQLTSFAKEINFDKLFQNAPPRNTMFLTQRQELDRHILSIRFDGFRPIIPQALTGGQKLTNILTNLTTHPNYYSGGKFKNLTIPFKTICTDIISGREVILDEGSLADAMRATMAFPLAFTGVEKNGQILMDGGMVTPIPVAIVKEMSKPGAFTVAVNTVSTLLKREKLVTPVDIANQVTIIMTADQLDAQLALADFTITPPLGELSMGDFEYCDSLIQLGYQAGLSAADNIITLLENKQAKKIYYIYQLEIDPRLQKHTDIFFSHFWKKQLKKSELISRLKSLTTKLNLFKLEATITSIIENPSNKKTGKTSLEMITLSLSGFPNLPFDELTFKFHGNSIFDDSTLEARLHIDDTFLTPDNLKEGLDRIKGLYYKEKYNLTDIHETNIDPVGKIVTIEIDEAIINEIKIVNNRRTRDWFVRSYFPMEVGQPYSTQLATRGITNIYSTGLFDRVSLDLMPTENGAEVKLHVMEKKYNQLRLGWHWDDEYESEEFVEFLDDNTRPI